MRVELSFQAMRVHCWRLITDSEQNSKTMCGEIPLLISVDLGAMLVNFSFRDRVRAAGAIHWGGVSVTKRTIFTPMFYRRRLKQVSATVLTELNICGSVHHA